MRARTSYNPKASVYEYNDPIQYVKDVLDSKTPSVDGWDLEGHTILARRYSNLKDEKVKRIIAQAIVQLLDDPDYSCDAIPVAAECGIPEAKEWFLDLSKKSIEEIRNVKTNGYSNGLYCLLNYLRTHNINDFMEFTEKLLNESKDRLEILRAISILSDVKPELSLQKLPEYLPVIMKDESDKEIMTTLTISTSGIFKNYGDGYCIDLAKIFKSKLHREYYLLFYKALERNTISRFKPYLEELRKILEIKE